MIGRAQDGRVKGRKDKREEEWKGKVEDGRIGKGKKRGEGRKGKDRIFKAGEREGKRICNFHWVKKTVL